MLPLVAVAVAERAGWALARATSGGAGEAFNVARALATGRGFADAYRIGQGPTAHLMPIPPLIAGAAYSVFGVRSAAAEFVLATWSIALALGSYLLLLRAFARLGAPRAALIGAFAFLCVAPAYIGQEAVDFRLWEGGLAVALAALFLDRLTAIATPRAVTTGQLVLLAAIAATVFLVNPSLGLGSYAAAGLFVLFRLERRRWPAAALIAGAALALVLAPWTIRNARVMGHPIAMRSNAGLELSLANYPGALHAPSPRDALIARLFVIHPTQSDAAYARLQAVGGEVAYAAMQGEAAKRWIAAHPGEAAQLWALHVSQIFAPRPWQFQVFGSGMLPGVRAMLTSLVGLLGLLGIGRRLGRRDWSWAYPAAIVLVPAIAYAPFQPVVRYTYLFYALLTFLAADWLVAVGARAVGPVRRAAG